MAQGILRLHPAVISPCGSLTNEQRQCLRASVGTEMKGRKRVLGRAPGLDFGSQQTISCPLILVSRAALSSFALV